MGSTVPTTSAAAAAATSDPQQIPLPLKTSVSVSNLADGIVSPLELSGRRKGEMVYEVCMMRDGEGVKIEKGCVETKRVTLQVGRLDFR